MASYLPTSGLTPRASKTPHPKDSPDPLDGCQAQREGRRTESSRVQLIGEGLDDVVIPVSGTGAKDEGGAEVSGG